MLKFIMGPVLGTGYGFPLWLTALLTTIGMMLSVVSVSYLGENLRMKFMEKMRKRKRYKVITKRKRKIVRIWQKFGIQGVACFTPLLLTPIGGTLVALAFGVKRSKIIWYMFWNAIIWSLIITFFIEEINAFLSYLFK